MAVLQCRPDPGVTRARGVPEDAVQGCASCPLDRAGRALSGGTAAATAPAVGRWRAAGAWQSLSPTCRLPGGVAASCGEGGPPPFPSPSPTERGTLLKAAWVTPRRHLIASVTMSSLLLLLLAAAALAAGPHAAGALHACMPAAWGRRACMHACSLRAQICLPACLPACLPPMRPAYPSPAPAMPVHICSGPAAGGARQHHRSLRQGVCNRLLPVSHVRGCRLPSEGAGRQVRVGQLLRLQVHKK